MKLRNYTTTLTSTETLLSIQQLYRRLSLQQRIGPRYKISICFKFLIFNLLERCYYNQYIDNETLYIDQYCYSRFYYTGRASRSIRQRYLVQHLLYYLRLYFKRYYRIESPISYLS